MLWAGFYAIHAHWPWVWPMLGSVMGAVLGSFGACMIERRQRGVGLRHPPSHCPTCKKVLKPWELIPILSWLWQRGRCSTCRAAIPCGLVLAELVGALLGGGLLWLLLP